MWWMELARVTKWDCWTFSCSWGNVQTILTCLMGQYLVCRKMWHFCFLMYSATQSWLLMTLWKKSFENSLGKGENAGIQHFLLFSQCFLPFPTQVSSFQSHLFCHRQRLLVQYEILLVCWRVNRFWHDFVSENMFCVITLKLGYFIIPLFYWRYLCQN